MDTRFLHYINSGKVVNTAVARGGKMGYNVASEIRRWAGVIRENVPLSACTTLWLGRPANFLAEPGSEAELREAV